MSLNSTARKDADHDFYPGATKPARYRYADSFYRACYDGAWARLQKEAEEGLAREKELAEQGPTLEERVATLEEQVAELTRSLGL